MTSLWNIINMSDPYTLRSDDHEAIAAAFLMLGEGCLGVDELDVASPRRLPMFAFGRAGDLEPWWIETFGHPPSLEGLELRMAAVLETVVIGRPAARADYEAAMSAIEDPARRAAFATEWHDRHRTSLNDIGKRCRLYAAKLRQNYTPASAGDAQ
jgi:hypothetical protein